MIRSILTAGISLVALLGLAACSSQVTQSSPAASKGELNLYSARHYDADEQLYALFEKETGITLNRIELSGDQLIARMEAEGAQSPADVVLVVDAGVMWRAKEKGLFQPLVSDTLSKAIPEHLREPTGLWYGFAKRARAIAYSTERVKPDQVLTYASLTDPSFKGKICQRASSNIYNLSLMAAMIDHIGQEAALNWAKGVVGNFKRPAQGNDTDNLKAIAAGECDVTLSNHYYWARLKGSQNPDDQAVAAKVGLSFPDQAGVGTHINISGGALAAHAPNKENAIKFLEFLAKPEAQAILANANNEFPAVVGTVTDNPVLKGLPSFKEDNISLTVLGENQAKAQEAYDKAGWK